MSKVKLDLAYLDPDGVTGKAKAIKTAMTGNANFATPNPTLTVLGTDTTTAETKIAAQKNAIQAAKQATTDRDAALAVLCNDLTQLAAYVQNASGGDPVKIQSAGMDVKGVPTPTGPMTQVLNLAVSAGDNAGELDAQWDPVRGAKSYQVQVSPDPITLTSWRDVTPTSDSKTTITGLTSGARTWAQVRAIAKSGPGPWSDPAVKIVP